MEEKANNYMEITTDADKWSAADTSDPMADISTAQDAVEELTGSRPTILLMSKKTMGYLKKNKKINSAVLAQNVTANILMTDARVKELFSTELGISIVVYTKKYKDEAGNVHAFYPDDMVTLLPAGALGNTWYGTTPENRPKRFLPEQVKNSIPWPAPSKTVKGPCRTWQMCSWII